MPKHAVQKPKRNKYADNNRLADRIERTGRPVDSPCDYCLVRGKCCIMSSYANSRKCSTCARRGQTCERSFHSDKEWDDLQREEQKLSVDLVEAQKQFLQHSQKMNEAMAKILRLQKHQQFLKDRGGRMLDHDQVVADRLNEEDPPTAAEFAEFNQLAEQQEIRQLAATSEDASLMRMVASLDQDPSSFWAVPDASLLGVPGGFSSPAGGTVEPAGGSPSGSR